MSSEKKGKISFLLILVLSFFLRFFNLGWGEGSFYHPDENNMAQALSRLSWPKMDPQFYAYGQLPLYLAFFSLKIYYWLRFSPSTTITFPEAVLTLRFWSALLGVLSVWLVFLLAKKFFSKKLSLLPPLLAAFTPGLIQAAHFGTTESWLIFFFLFSLYQSLLFLEKKHQKHLFLASFSCGLAVATKISGVIFLAAPLTAWLLLFIKEKRKSLIQYIKEMKWPLLLIINMIVIAIIFSPYLLLNHEQSWSTLKYEIGVAQGKIPVFYTRQFLKTLPYLFQLQKVFPYALGLPHFLASLIGFSLILVKTCRELTKKSFRSSILPWLLIIVSALTYFLYNGHLFVKWTRFMAPLFPLAPLFATYFFQKLQNLPKAVWFFLVGLTILPGCFFLASVFFQKDIRTRASEWLCQNLPQNTVILSESGNVVPFPQCPSSSLKTIDFDFYSLEKNPEKLSQLSQGLSEANFLVIPSRRVFLNHQRLPEEFPQTNRYYQLLFSGQLGFTPLKQFNPYPGKISDEKAEETWSVFDHPVIRIYQKEAAYSSLTYQEMLIK
ncbi:glycosyltransferase family 39 protein [Candidatus Shapirobacteria bacterium]|nr:glycosyltransferase family 39 protein [Candidatus Shapirobacteria bacterium]